MANKRRCNQCRDYFEPDVMVKVGSVWVCSQECREAKLKANHKAKARKQAEQPRKQEIREAVAKRDGDFCLVCGDPNTHLHRVIYGSEGGKYEVGNTVLLCYHHHNADGEQAVHMNKKKDTQPLLLAYIGGDPSARRKLIRHLSGGDVSDT